jgi:hypothetical protein
VRKTKQKKRNRLVPTVQVSRQDAGSWINLSIFTAKVSRRTGPGLPSWHGHRRRGPASNQILILFCSSNVNSCVWHFRTDRAKLISFCHDRLPSASGLGEYVQYLSVTVCLSLPTLHPKYYSKPVLILVPFYCANLLISFPGKKQARLRWIDPCGLISL